MKKLFAKPGFWLTAFMVLTIIVTVLLNVFVSMLGERYSLTFDLTANSAYKLGSESKEILANLNKEVDIYVLANENYFSGNSYIVQAGKIIEEYPKNTPLVKLSYVDYESDPSFAATYPDLTLSIGNVLVTCGDKVKQLQITNFFNYEYDLSGNFNITSSRAEEVMTSAILYVINEDTVKVGILNGNGVFDNSSLKLVLEDNNFDVFDVNMVSDSFEDYDVLVLSSPAVDISADVLSKFDAFLKNNGQYGKTLFYTASVTQPELPNLNVFLSEWGISVDDGTVFETSKDRTYNYQPYYAVAQYEDTEVTDKLKDTDTPIVVPLARPLTNIFEFKDNHYTQTLLSFSSTAGVRPSDAPEDFVARQAEKWGPFPAMTLCTYKVSDASSEKGYLQSAVVVSSSTHVLDKAFLQNSSFSNMEYIVDLLSFLTDKEQSIAISSKTLTGNSLGITSSQVTALGIILCIIIPVIILVTGIFIWVRRRFN